MQTSVIVSCVPPNLTIEQLKAHFGKNKKNNVIQVQWLKQPRTGSSGIAEVQVGSIEAAQYLCDRKQIIKGHELHLFCPQTVSGCPEDCYAIKTYVNKATLVEIMKQSKITGVQINREGRRVFVDIPAEYQIAKTKLFEEAQNLTKLNEYTPPPAQNQIRPPSVSQVSMNQVLAKMPNSRQNNGCKLDAQNGGFCSHCQYDHTYTESTNDPKYCTGPKLPYAQQLQRTDEENLYHDNL